MRQNNKKFNNAMHKFVGVLDKYDGCATFFSTRTFDTIKNYYQKQGS